MKSIVSILMILLFSFIFSCQKNNSTFITGNEKQVIQNNLSISEKEEINELSNKLDILARNMAFALNNDKVLEELRNRFFNADNKFKIIDLKEWMNSEINGESIAQRMAKSGNMEMIDGKKTKISAHLLINLVKSIKPSVDFYFPIKSHRFNWFENKKNLLVASVNIADEWAPIKAYSLSGQSITLDPNTPTSVNEPVLVIIPCEHHSVHKGNFNTIMEETTPPGDGGGGSGGGYPQPYKLYLEDMYIIDDCEPIYAEPAEIYFKVNYIGNSSIQSTDTPWDDLDDRWYTDKFLTIFSSYDYGNEWHIEVWESDDIPLGGDDHLENFDVYQGINLGQMLNGTNNYVNCRFTTYHP